VKKLGLIALIMLVGGLIQIGEAQSPSSFTDFTDASQPAPSFRSFLHDRPQMLAATVAMGSKSFDLGQTLWHRDHYQKFHEDWLPSQKPGWIALNMVGSQATATVLQYHLYKRGRKRLAIAVQCLSAGASVSGSLYSFSHVTITRAQQTASSPGCK
jgi:hypothetical protein